MYPPPPPIQNFPASPAAHRPVHPPLASVDLNAESKDWKEDNKLDLGPARQRQQITSGSHTTQSPTATARREPGRQERSLSNPLCSITHTPTQVFEITRHGSRGAFPGGSPWSSDRVKRQGGAGEQESRTRACPGGSEVARGREICHQ